MFTLHYHTMHDYRCVHCVEIYIFILYILNFYIYIYIVVVGFD